MKLVRLVGMALLFLPLGAPGAFAQHEGRGRADKPQKNAEQTKKSRGPSQSGRSQSGRSQSGQSQSGQSQSGQSQSGQSQSGQSQSGRHLIGGRGPALPPPPPALPAPPRPPLARGAEHRPLPAVGQQGPGAHPQQRAVPRPPALPEGRHAQAATPRPLRSEQQVREWQQRRGWAVRGSWQAHATWDLHRAQRWQLEHRTWSQRGGYGGFFVPIERFRLFFGLQHPFRLYARPTIIGGYPRFWYGGYWWMIVDPWPEFWANNWYETDDLYIDYSDGYYLHSRRHPGVSLAISVAF
jgi:hypothetical protein